MPSFARAAFTREVAALWPTPPPSRRGRRGRLAAIRQPDAHTIGTARERQPPGRDPAGAAAIRQVPPPSVNISPLAAIRQPDAHTIGTACERSRLAAIGQVLATR